MCVVKSTLSFFWALLTYDLTIILFAAGFLSDNDKVKVAGGIMGVINAFADWFEAFAGVANRQNSYMVPREIPLPDLSVWLKRKKLSAKHQINSKRNPATITLKIQYCVLSVLSSCSCGHPRCNL